MGGGYIGDVIMWECVSHVIKWLNEDITFDNNIRVALQTHRMAKWEEKLTNWKMDLRAIAVGLPTSELAPIAVHWTAAYLQQLVGDNV